MSPQSDALRAEFERRLGRRSQMAHEANKRRPGEAALKAPTSQHGRRGTRAQLASGTSRVSAETKKRYKKQFGSSSSVATFQKTMNKIVDDSLRVLNEKVATEKAIQLAMEAPAPPVENQEPGWLDKGIAMVQGLPGPGVFFGGKGYPVLNYRERVKDEMNTEPGEAGHWQGIMEDFSRSPAGRAGDLISRPFNAVQTGFNESLKATYGTDEEGTPDDFWHSFDDLAGGFWQGLAGEKTTGAGDVWQTMRQNSEMPGFQELRELEESHPNRTKWIDRAVGLTGELAMDPANWVGGAGVGILRKSGQQLTESTAKEAVRETVQTAAANFFDEVVASTGGLRNKPSREALEVLAANIAEDSIEKNLLEISGGTHAGFGKMGGALTARSAANRVTDGIRNAVFKSFDSRVSRITDALQGGGNLPIHSWRTHLSQSPELDNLLNRVWDAKDPDGVIFKTRDEVIASLSSKDVPLITRLADGVRQELDASLVQHVTDEIYEQTRQLYYNTIGIRVGGKIIPIKTFGKAYGYTKERLPERLKATAEDFAAKMSFEHNAPGRMALVTQANKSIGAKVLEDFHREWSKIARKFSKEDDLLVYRALGGDPSPLPPHLEELKVLMRTEFDNIWKEARALGARKESDAYAENFVPVFNRGGKVDERRSFKKQRKDTIHETGNAGRWTADYAKSGEVGHLRPVESAFDSLFKYKQKAVRDNTRAMLMKDLVENYGSMSKPLTEYTIQRRGLVSIPVGRLPQYMRTIAKEQGVEYYLPKEHKQFFDTVNEITKWESPDADAAARFIRDLTNKIKWISTVPRLGFHTRNFVGDVFMGILDKIPTRTYTELLRKYQKHLHKQPTSFRISGDISLSWDQLKARYDMHANSGLITTEIPLGERLTGSHLRKRTANLMRRASDMREDYGRMVHFLGALRQEAKNFSKRIKDPNKLLEKATEAAVWRVNKYKYDYGALTAFERKIKLLFPFYTFSRKAAPALLQQLFLNPKYMGLANRFMQYNDGSAADNFNNFYLPDYVKDIGYAMLNDEEEPLYMTQDILPTNVLNSIDFTNSQQFAQSVGQQFNPLAQILPEIALGEKIFDQRATGSFPEYIMNKFSIPGQLGRQISPDNQSPQWLQALNESFTGLGIPVRQFTTEQQDWGFRNAEDRFIQDPFRDFNRSQDFFRVYQSDRKDGTSFRVENVATGEVVFESMNPTEALQAAKRLVP